MFEDKLYVLQPFAFKHKPQTFSCVCLRSNSVFAISNGALSVGNVSVLEVQMRLLFWPQLSCFGMGNYTL